MIELPTIGDMVKIPLETGEIEGRVVRRFIDAVVIDDGFVTHFVTDAQIEVAGFQLIAREPEKGTPGYL